MCASDDSLKLSAEPLMKVLTYDRLMLRMPKREEPRIQQLLRYSALDPYLDSVEKIIQFTRESYIERRGIRSDTELRTPKPMTIE